MPSKPKPPDDGGKQAPKGPPYAREDWIPEIPFDVAEWGDKPLMYPDGLFRTEAEYEEAIRRAGDLRQTPSDNDPETAERGEL